MFARVQWAIIQEYSNIVAQASLYKSRDIDIRPRTHTASIDRCGHRAYGIDDCGALSSGVPGCKGATRQVPHVRSAPHMNALQNVTCVGLCGDQHRTYDEPAAGVTPSCQPNGSKFK